MSTRTAAPRETTYAAPRANRYPGPCALCGGRVGAQAGVLVSGKPQHTPGTCPERTAPAAAAPAPAYRVNRFPGSCTACGGWVGEGAGRVDRTPATSPARPRPVRP